MIEMLRMQPDGDRALPSGARSCRVSAAWAERLLEMARTARSRAAAERERARRLRSAVLLAKEQRQLRGPYEPAPISSPLASSGAPVRATPRLRRQPRSMETHALL